MHNAFLVARTVIFALLMYFHVLVLLFTSWNIASAKSSGISAPGASVLLLMSSIFIFVLVPLAYLAEVICPRARPAHVRVECAWTALMSILQLAASIIVTMNGPPVHCQAHLPWAMCASSSLLTHISWLGTLIVLSYCLTLCIASATHAMSLPDIWITPVSRVPWFRPDIEAQAPAPTQKHTKHPSSSWSEPSCVVSKYIAERWEKLSRSERQRALSGPSLFAKGSQPYDTARPDWARLRITRRGVDVPFAKPPPKCGVPSVPPVVPLGTYSRQAMVSRDSHSMECGVWSDDGTHSHLTLVPPTSTVFPRRIINPDLPIPRPGLSQWVRADHGSPPKENRTLHLEV